MTKGVALGIDLLFNRLFFFLTDIVKTWLHPSFLLCYAFLYPFQNFQKMLQAYDLQDLLCRTPCLKFLKALKQKLAFSKGTSCYVCTF